eukprot:COSAG06_NODE_2550_length_6687_cov_4.096843_5_plen_69_part_00
MRRHAVAPALSVLGVKTGRAKEPMRQSTEAHPHLLRARIARVLDQPLQDEECRACQVKCDTPIATGQR